MKKHVFKLKGVTVCPSNTFTFDSFDEVDHLFGIKCIIVEDGHDPLKPICTPAVICKMTLEPNENITATIKIPDYATDSQVCYFDIKQNYFVACRRPSDGMLLLTLEKM